jgi:hypothetical protein
MSMTDETIPRVMINALTGESQTIQLRPRAGLTVADVEAFFADRRAAAQLINPENCETIKYYTEVLDIYGLFDVPDEWNCVGSELFVRNLPDGEGVWFGDLPKEVCKTLLDRGVDRQASR